MDCNQHENIEQLRKLFWAELGDLLHVENMLLKALPRMSEAARSSSLRTLLTRGLAESKSHLERINAVFKLGDLPAREKKCEGMLGLLQETQQLIQRGSETAVIDYALLCSAEKIWQYKTVSCRSMVQWASLSKDREAAAIIRKILQDLTRTGGELQVLAESIHTQPTEPVLNRGRQSAASKKPPAPIGKPVDPLRAQLERLRSRMEKV